MPYLGFPFQRPLTINRSYFLSFNCVDNKILSTKLKKYIL